MTASRRNICRHARVRGETSARSLEPPMSTASQIQDIVHSWISSACRQDEPLQPRTHARPDQRQLNTLHRLYQTGGPDLPSKTQSVAAVYFRRLLGRLRIAIGPFPSLTSASVEAKRFTDDSNTRVIAEALQSPPQHYPSRSVKRTSHHDGLPAGLAISFKEPDRLITLGHRCWHYP